MNVSCFVLSSVATLAFTCLTGGPVARANPLAEHRDSMRPGASAAYAVSATIRAVGIDGKIVLSVPSARLMSAGLRSGDQVLIQIGGRSLSAHAAFRDELLRSSQAVDDSDEQISPAPDMTLVVDRERPGENVVLDASAGGGITAHDVRTGQALFLTTVRRVRR